MLHHVTVSRTDWDYNGQRWSWELWGLGAVQPKGRAEVKLKNWITHPVHLCHVPWNWRQNRHFQMKTERSFERRADVQVMQQWLRPDLPQAFWHVSFVFPWKGEVLPEFWHCRSSWSCTTPNIWDILAPTKYFKLQLAGSHVICFSFSFGTVGHVTLQLVRCGGQCAPRATGAAFLAHWVGICWNWWKFMKVHLTISFLNILVQKIHTRHIACQIYHWLTDSWARLPRVQLRSSAQERFCIQHNTNPYDPAANAVSHLSHKLTNSQDLPSPRNVELHALSQDFESGSRLKTRRWNGVPCRGSKIFQNLFSTQRHTSRLCFGIYGIWFLPVLPGLLSIEGHSSLV